MATRYEIKCLMQDADAMIVRAIGQASLLRYRQVVEQLQNCRDIIDRALLEIEQAD